jgi:hypothetical protein
LRLSTSKLKEPVKTDDPIFYWYRVEIEATEPDPEAEKTLET